jgi:hypothetical protein
VAESSEFARVSAACLVIRPTIPPRLLPEFAVIEEAALRHAVVSIPTVFACEPDESCGYDRDDPKHPDWHSVHADLWDMREGK